MRKKKKNKYTWRERKNHWGGQTTDKTDGNWKEEQINQCYFFRINFFAMIILSKLSNLKKNNFLPSLKYTHIFMTTKYMSTSPMEPSLSSIPQEQFQPLVALFHCTCYSLQFWSAVPRVCLCKALYQGSVKGDIGAPLRKNLRVCGLQNMNTMSFTFQKSNFPKM